MYQPHHYHHLLLDEIETREKMFTQDQLVSNRDLDSEKLRKQRGGGNLRVQILCLLCSQWNRFLKQLLLKSVDSSLGPPGWAPGTSAFILRCLLCLGSDSCWTLPAQPISSPFLAKGTHRSEKWVTVLNLSSWVILDSSKSEVLADRTPNPDEGNCP